MKELIHHTVVHLDLRLADDLGVKPSPVFGVKKRPNRLLFRIWIPQPTLSPTLPFFVFSCRANPSGISLDVFWLQRRRSLANVLNGALSPLTTEQFALYRQRRVYIFAP